MSEQHELLERELQNFRSALPEVKDEDGLYQLQVQYLGKKGSITVAKRAMGGLEPEERKSFGKAYNTVKTTVESEIAARRQALADEARERELARRIDLSSVEAEVPGTLHPITQTRRELEAIFRRLGFDVAEGPHVEHERYNFDDLNIPSGHPARDMQDTFVISAQGEKATDEVVLRSHTSPVQIRTMLGYRPPIRIIAPGTVFRRDDDATHTPMFHQIEGLYIDKGVTMADLKATLFAFVGALFGEGLGVRLRPSYFPFVEPGAEFDMECPFCREAAAEDPNAPCSTCKGSRWIELGGSGMVHPAVLEAVGIDPEIYSGWAFGFGIDRMAMLRRGVRDLRTFFDGDLRFVEQFPC